MAFDYVMFTKLFGRLVTVDTDSVSQQGCNQTLLRSRGNTEIFPTSASRRDENEKPKADQVSDLCLTRCLLHSASCSDAVMHLGV